MTTKEYLKAIQDKYPNTFIGLNAYYKQLDPNMVTFVNTSAYLPLDYVISRIIRYLEYRQVNFLEALSNTHIEYPSASHEELRFKTTSLVLNRLEKFITPAEGKPF